MNKRLIAWIVLAVVSVAAISGASIPLAMHIAARTPSTNIAKGAKDDARIIDEAAPMPTSPVDDPLFPMELLDPTTPIRTGHEAHFRSHTYNTEVIEAPRTGSRWTVYMDPTFAGNNMLFCETGYASLVHYPLSLAELRPGYDAKTYIANEFIFTTELKYEDCIEMGSIRLWINKEVHILYFIDGDNR